jgi:hypothetical protein
MNEYIQAGFDNDSFDIIALYNVAQAGTISMDTAILCAKNICKARGYTTTKKDIPNPGMPW